MGQRASLKLPNGLPIRIPIELLVILVILAGVAIITQAINSERAQTQTPALISDSANNNGAKGLYLWLDELGYDVRRLQYQRFELDSSTSVMFMLAPRVKPTVEELNALGSWVERGGTLIVADGGSALSQQIPLMSTASEDMPFGAVLKKFGLKTQRFEEPKTEATPSQPLLIYPPVAQVTVKSDYFFTGDDKLVPYLGDYAHPVAVGLALGKGHVYAFSSLFAFSNEGLKSADNAALVLNWLPSPDKSGVVAFDEIHHGRIAEQTIEYDMVHEPWGWAVLFGLAMLFVYLLLGGRRFGRAIPAIADNRRLAAEYVISMAGLLRRGGKSAWVAGHYERSLRRRLATVCGLGADDDITALFERLEQIGKLPGGVDGREARRVLLALRQGATKPLSEAALVRLAAETERTIKALGGRR